jgi:hypothetical protein
MSRSTSLPKALTLLVLLIHFLPIFGQSASTFDVAGVLTFIDQPPEATPVDAVSFRVHPLAGGFDIEAQPNREGAFVLKGVHAGRYSLTFPMPGRLEVFAVAGKESAPEDFELTSRHPRAISIVVSMKSATVAVRVLAAPSGESNVIALLVPADDHLTLRESCYSNQLSGPQTSFPFVPPGKYRVLAFNTKYLQVVAGLAPRFPEFLKNEAVIVEANSAVEVSATPLNVTDKRLEEAIRLAGGPFDPFKDYNHSTTKP